MRNSILGNLGSTGDQSRIKCPGFFNQRRGRSPNVNAASTGLPVGVVKVLVSFYRRGEDSAFEAIEAGSLSTFQSNPERQLSRRLRKTLRRH